MKTTARSQYIIEHINRLNPLANALGNASNDHDKLEILNQDSHVHAFIQQSPQLQTFLAGLNPSCDVVIKSVLAIGQGAMVFQQMDQLENPYEKLQELIGALLPAESFYAHLGGIVGYHLTVLKLLVEKQNSSFKDQTLLYTKPVGFDLSTATPEVHKALREGIENLSSLAEIYPVGGAGERLQLRDEQTDELLPVAQLQFCGRSLLEGLIRDLQGREYLYYKLTGKQTTTPVAMMTSHEKRNHERMTAICERAHWFGRPKESFRFFIQPLVPVISVEGDWCLSAPLQLILKPGGHGVMWKLAQEAGIFDWFERLHRPKALIRQINNPIAGIDIGLLAFTGVGFSSDKSFGFASCFRVLNAAEGMNVLVERPVDGGYACTITNIEYTDFTQKGIEDIPAAPGSPYSAFPANTNILFADLAAVQKAMERCPVPGTLLNMKSEVNCLSEEGHAHQIHAGRLESTMQNIADEIINFFPRPITPSEQAQLKTYVTYNHRHRTISVTKKSFSAGQSPLETPESCFYDLQRNAHELLRRYCLMQVPDMADCASFAEQAPAFIVNLHPALGPAFDVIAAKIRGGILCRGAELTIEAAEIELEEISLDGSLHILAANPLGHSEGDHLTYSEQNGKCVLKKVAIQNKGVDWSLPQDLWRGRLQRQESLTITLHGNGEFHAENVTIAGPLHIEVPHGFRVEALPAGDSYTLVQTKLTEASWFWKYSFAPDHRIVLQKVIAS